MNAKRTALGAAVISIFGTGLDEAGKAHAGPVEAGAYDLVVLTTPVTTAATTSAATGFKLGKDGNWNSSFTFGGTAPYGSSQGMTDTGAARSPDDVAGGFSTHPCGSGSGVGGDTFAGRIGINIAPTGALSVNSFSKDTIFNTAGDDFLQYLGAAGTSQMTGNVILNTGAMTLTPTGRLGAINTPLQCDKPWNIADAPPENASTYGSFSTQTATTEQTLINGTVFSSIGDMNGDGIADYSGILVSGGTIGTAWGGFVGADYFEIWRSQFLSKGPFVRDDTFGGPAGQTTNHAVLANDLPTTGLTVTGVTQGSNGSVAIAPGGGSVNYMANAGVVGIDTYTYTATGPGGTSNTATVTVINADPGAVADPGATQQGAAINNLNLTANDFATAGINLATYAPVSPSTKGATVTSNGNGTVTYTPLPDIAGTDTFTYTFQDNSVPAKTSNVATVTVTVSPGPLVSQGTYGPGTIAQGAGKPSGVIDASDIPEADTGVTASCVGGCFDFIITGAAASTSVVLPPLNTPINTASNLRYRIFEGGAWKDFDTSGGDSIASTTITANGGCPGPGAASWKVWTSASPGATNQGDDCLRLSIADNGNNDSDKTNPTTIADTGGLGASIAQDQPSGTIDEFLKSTSGGCSINGENVSFTSRADWAVLGLFGAWLGAFRLRRKMQR